MKIALLGYGKMGKMIEKIAVSRGHQVVSRIEGWQQQIDFQGAEVAIDFSVPISAVHHITSAVKAGIPVVSGTTGWLEGFEQVKKTVYQHHGALVYSSNYSLGVNIFFEINKTLARLMQPYSQYSISAQEIHHTQKLDAPSGTAITLLENILEENNKYTSWQLTQNNQATDQDKIPIQALRIDDTPGTHTVKYSSDVDSIEICHTAHSREGFALGAIVASEWIVGREGVFSMRDVIFGQ